MFLFVIVFLTVSIMIPEPLKSILNFKTQYLAPQMYRECRLFYREWKTLIFQEQIDVVFVIVFLNVRTMIYQPRWLENYTQ